MPPAVSPGADSAASAGSGSLPARGPAGVPGGLPGLRDRLRSGAPIAATFVMIPRVEIVEMAVGAGFGAVVCDLEHGHVATEDLPALHAAARAAGAYSLARIASDRPVEISRALDMGVDGVIVPHVGTRAAAEQVVAAGRFAPVGERSLNPYVRGVGYGLDDSDPTGQANERSALVAMIEGTDALGAVSEIAAVTELDALFFGPVDLAGSLGHPGQPEHPEVVAMIGDLVDRLAAAGVATGIYAPTAEAARRWLSLGVRLVVTSADNAMTMSAFAAMRTAIGEPAVPVARQPGGHGTRPGTAGRPAALPA